jgi:phosphate transport system permease protein
MTSSPKVSMPMGKRPESERSMDRLFFGFTRAFAIGIGLILVSIAVVIFLEALPAIGKFNLGFLFSSDWNPVEKIALVIAIPLGIGTALFLSENFIPKQVRTILTFLVELLAAVPSVVYGLWGIYVLIPFLNPIADWLHNKLGWFPLFNTSPSQAGGMLPAGVILAIMILPIITAISRDSLASLPPELRQASLGLGATRWETIFRVLIPAAFSGIVGGIMLGLGRAMGETMAVTMVIGNSNTVSSSILAPAYTISSRLANEFAEASGMQVSALMYAGLVLMLLTLVVNVLADLIVGKVKAKYN